MRVSLARQIANWAARGARGSTLVGGKSSRLVFHILHLIYTKALPFICILFLSPDIRSTLKTAFPNLTLPATQTYNKDVDTLTHITHYPPIKNRVREGVKTYLKLQTPFEIS